MLVNGESFNTVAQYINVRRNTMISRLQTRFQHYGTVCYFQRSGRPRVTTPGQDHYINRMHTKNSFRNDALESGKFLL